MRREDWLVVLVILSCCLCVGCGGEQGSLPPVDYVRWVKDPSNGLLQSKEVKSYSFLAQYKPIEFMIVQEERREELPQERLESRRADFGVDYLYYNFRIKNTEGELSPLGSGVESDQVYQRRLGYFTFEMQEDLYLLHGQDTFPCVLFQFVRSYDVAPYVEFALGFEKPSEHPLTEALTFVFEDRVLGIGTTRLLFDPSIIQNIPLLKTS